MGGSGFDPNIRMFMNFYFEVKYNGGASRPAKLFDNGPVRYLRKTHNPTTRFIE